MSEWLTEQGIFLLRVIVAGVCGLAIGIERQSRMKTAGCGHILWWRWHPL